MLALRRRAAAAVAERLHPPRPPFGPLEQVAALSATPADDSFITGNGIAARCRYVLNFDAFIVNEDVDNDWWFCKTDYLDYFFRALAPSEPFVLFTHNSARAIGRRFRRQLNRDRLVAWFAQNPVIEHPKLRALPLGLANPFWPHGDQRVFKQIAADPPAKSKLFDVTFAVRTNPAVRSYCIEQTGLQPAPRRPYDEYLRGVASAYFCVSPEGMGVDCLRTWEALYLRTVPVVTKSIVAAHHSDMPILVLDDWADFGKIDFSPELYRELWGDWDPAELRLDRYMERVASRITTFGTPSLTGTRRSRSYPGAVQDVGSTALERPVTDPSRRIMRRIQPSGGLIPIDVEELWRYRGLARFFLVRDVKARYRQTFLGPAWAVLRPLMTIVIFSAIFGGLAGIKPGSNIPYPLFVTPGVLAMSYFSSALAGTSASLLASGGLLSKVYFPRLYAPFSAALTPFVDLFSGAARAVGAVRVLRSSSELAHRLPAACSSLLAALVATSDSACGSAGLDRSLSRRRLRASVRAPDLAVRDACHLPGLVRPAEYRWLLALNPLTAVVAGFRWSLLGSSFGDTTVLYASLGLAFVVVTLRPLRLPALRAHDRGHALDDRARHQRARPRQALSARPRRVGLSASAPARPPSPGRRTHVGARDVTFDVPEGSALAVIGRNGAGKSTLLKLLARITEPTPAMRTSAGRVGALLEVGHRVQRRADRARERLPQRHAPGHAPRTRSGAASTTSSTFAGVEQHIDTPVKWYSTGMYIRLGFAVAAHLEPEILVVDEVLAVGDTEFQKRCLARMGMAGQEGRTVLFVSHNMQAVRRICSERDHARAGQIVSEGDIDAVIRNYLASVESRGARAAALGGSREAPGDELCRIVEVRVTDADGQALDVRSSAAADQRHDRVRPRRRRSGVRHRLRPRHRRRRSRLPLLPDRHTCGDHARSPAGPERDSSARSRPACSTPAATSSTSGSCSTSRMDRARQRSPVFRRRRRPRRLS